MGMTSSDLSRLSPNTITLSSASPFKKGGLGESPENGHPTKPTPHEWITLRRDNLYRRDGPLPSNGSISPRPRPTIARQFIPKGRGIYLEKPPTLHFDPSHAREILPRKKFDPWVIDFGWTAIPVVDHRATDSDGLETSWEASLCHRDHFDSAYAREILPRKKVDPWVIDLGGRRSTRSTAGRPTRMALKLLGRLPCVIGINLTQHMHLRFCLEKKLTHG
ncbi:uncharacterized protein G2W53_040058 [Senna tora]|uniref:Uncharacterized protein n=1 Tax=Senna tora TaxID=362788 RepID=A0A834SQG4_9FABA|nr:uncharacterized protein G2W53_040058 [Senna tora]